MISIKDHYREKSVKCLIKYTFRNRNIMYPCDLCPSLLANSSSYWRHRLSVHERRLVNCEVPGCGRQYTAGYGSNHRWRYHCPPDHLVCSECDYKFTTRVARTQHERQVHGGPRDRFPCPQCDSTFSTAGGVRQHTLSVHQMVKLYCGICGRSYRYRGSLRSHQINSHEQDGITHTCRTCAREFSNPRSLAQHERTHKE